MALFLHFIFSFMVVLGFCTIFHVPVRHIPAAAFIGSTGWFLYQLCLGFHISTIISCFLASCAVGLLSDIASRLLKDAATIFIIPGILCLVPGSGMYDTMLELVSGNLSEAAATGIRTLMLAGSIALGLLVISAAIRIVVTIARKAVHIANKL